MKKKRLAKVKKTIPRKKEKSWLNIILGSILAIFGFLLYANTLNHGFAFDDGMVLEKNYIVQQGWSGIPTIWTTDYTRGFEHGLAESYRPVSLTMFAIEWAISPNNPAFHHWIHVLLYALTGFLLFITLQKIIKHPQKQLFSFITTAIYLALPVHTEVVANIKSRDELLAFLFLIIMMNSLWAYLDKQKISYWIGAIIAFGLAIASKESALTFIVIIPLTIWFFKELPIKKIALTTLPFLVPILIFLLVRQEIINIDGPSESALTKAVSGGDLFSSNFDKTNSIGNFLKTTFLVLANYLELLIYPTDLNSHSFYRSYRPENWLNGGVIFGAFVYIACSIGVLINWTKKHVLAYSWIVYTISLSLAAYLLIITAESYIERFLYTPSLGYAMALSFAIIYLLKVEKTTPIKQFNDFFAQYKMPLILTGCICLIYGSKTIDRNQAWENSLTLFKTDLAQHPDIGQLYFNYGAESLNMGIKSNQLAEKQQLFGEAEAALKQMLLIKPNFGLTDAQLGLLYYQQGKQEEALIQYEAAIEKRPGYAMAHNNAGMIYYLKGDLGKAKAAYQKAVELNPRYADAIRNLGGVYMLEKKYTEAIPLYEKALQFTPTNADIIYFLGNAYIKTGNEAKGNTLTQQAINLDPTLKGVKFY